MKYILITLLLFYPIFSNAQTKWKKPDVKETEFTLFKSIQALNHHTAEVVPAGDIYYGISHRFIGTIDDGFETFFGMDGGAIMRTKLGYGITDNFMATIGRASRASVGNARRIYDLELKYKLWSTKDFVIPIIISAQGIVSYTDEISTPLNAPDNFEIEFADQMQYIGQLMINTMLFDRIGIGFNPTYLYNSYCACIDETKSSFTLGSYLQFYFGDDMTSIVLESNNTLSGFRGDGINEYYDSYNIGVELETGGHFFKLLVGNNTNINLSQYIVGSTVPFSLNNLHLGFQITRNF